MTRRKHCRKAKNFLVNFGCRGKRDDLKWLPLRSSHIQRKNYFYFAFVALCGALQTHFHGRGVVTANGSCSAAFCESAALRNTILTRENGIAERPQVFRYPGLIKLFCAQRKHHCAGTSFLRSRNLMPAGHIIPFLPGLPPGLRWRLRRRLLPSRPAARR